MNRYDESVSPGVPSEEFRREQAALLEVRMQRGADLATPEPTSLADQAFTLHRSAYKLMEGVSRLNAVLDELKNGASPRDLATRIENKAAGSAEAMPAGAQMNLSIASQLLDETDKSLAVLGQALFEYSMRVGPL